MADELTIMWDGISGKEYKYWITPIESTFKPVAGNYIFAKEVEPHKWTPIYIGETDNLEERLTSNHEKMPCVKRNGGTHLHTHTSTNDEITRRKEESDIIAKWKPLCNSED